jgi:hypothetical protein
MFLNFSPNVTGADVWQPDGAILSQLHLSQVYSGSALTIAQPPAPPR